MTLPVQQHRKVEIKFYKTVQDGHIDSVLIALRQIDAVVKVKASRLSIKIEYLFPMISYSEIWTVLLQSLDKNQFSIFQVLRNSYLAYLEENEQAHLTRQYGWDIYIRNVYISYFHQGGRQTRHVPANTRM